MPYTISSSVFCLGLVLLSNQTIAQQSPAIDQINAISGRNTTVGFSWDRVHLEIDGSDTLWFITEVNKEDPMRIFMGAVICMNQLDCGNYVDLRLYARKGDSSTKVIRPFTFEHSDSVKVLMDAFARLFQERGYPIPPTTCPAYEIDLLAQKFAIRPFENSVDIPRAVIYSMDSMVEGYTVLHYLNGNQLLERNVKNGKLNGIQRAYFENGAVFYEATFLDGLQAGDEFYYFQSGIVSSKRSFVNGLEHGYSILYWENGQMNIRSKMVNGGLDSEEAWYEDGTPQE